MQNIPKVTFKEVVRAPATYYMLVAISVMWVFVMLFKDSSKQVSDNCETEKDQLRSDLNKERTKNDDLTMALLVKNGIINEIKKVTDSVARESFANEAKKIIKK